MTRTCRIAAIAWACWGTATVLANDFPPSWQPVTWEAARTGLEQWLDESGLPAERVAEVRALWGAAEAAASDQAEVAGTDLLQLAASTFAAADPRAAQLVEACRSAPRAPSVGEADWLHESASPLVGSNLRLVLARRLLQDGLYDECLLQLEGLQPSDVLDPASLLFCRMAALHQLVQPDEARAAAIQLLEQQQRLPQRYVQLARLVQEDLEGLQDESLDHIARRMRDIRRRLELGRAGSVVQGIEQGVLDSLDDLIKQQEERQKQQQQQQSASPGGAPSGRPLEESRPAELKAPGLVDRKDIGDTSGWGDLPAKDRETALQQVGRDFPAHYRELIEQYFRELAAAEGASAP